jgi:hypothetical protein
MKKMKETEKKIRSNNKYSLWMVRTRTACRKYAALLCKGPEWGGYFVRDCFFSFFNTKIHNSPAYSRKKECDE